MSKRIFAAALALALCMGGALAEVYRGATVAAATVAVAAESGGVLEEARVRAGAVAAAGEPLGALRTRKVYAAEDGTVARVLAQEGARVDGAVLELAPDSRYTVYCSVDGAYQTASSTHVRAGEELYLRCTANGTHRGTGIVTQIDGADYQVEATGGEFYVGETVNLYRDADFTSTERVGVGTVVGAGVRSYESQGYLVRLHVEAGEYVQRGELLYECADSGETELTAPTGGIVTEAAQQGAKLQAGEAAFRLAPLEQIRVEAYVDEIAAASIEPGEEVAMIFADDPEEAVIAGTVESVSRVAQDGQYAVRVASAQMPARLGLTAYVQFGEDG